MRYRTRPLKLDNETLEQWHDKLPQRLTVAFMYGAHPIPMSIDEDFEDDFVWIVSDEFRCSELTERLSKMGPLININFELLPPFNEIQS